MRRLPNHVARGARLVSVVIAGLTRPAPRLVAIVMAVALLVPAGVSISAQQRTPAKKVRVAFLYSDGNLPATSKPTKRCSRNGPTSRTGRLHLPHRVDVRRREAGRDGVGRCAGARHDERADAPAFQCEAQVRPRSPACAKRAGRCWRSARGLLPKENVHEAGRDVRRHGARASGSTAASATSSDC